MELVALYHFEADLYEKPDELWVKVVDLFALHILLVCFEDPEEVFDLGGVVFFLRSGCKLLDSYLLEHVHEEHKARVAGGFLLDLLYVCYNLRLEVF